MPSILVSLVCMICIFFSLVSMTIHDDLSAFLGMKIKPVVTNVASAAAALGSFSLNKNEAPTKQDVIFELFKKLKLLKDFNTSP